MKEFLKKVSVLDYPDFRELAMKECNWNYQQYNNRLQGRTKVTHLEAEKLNDIVKQLTKKSKSWKGKSEKYSKSEMKNFNVLNI